MRIQQMLGRNTNQLNLFVSVGIYGIISVVLQKRDILQMSSKC
jgi:hypothetical protein